MRKKIRSYSPNPVRRSQKAEKQPRKSFIVFKWFSTFIIPILLASFVASGTISYYSTEQAMIKDIFNNDYKQLNKSFLKYDQKKMELLSNNRRLANVMANIKNIDWRLLEEESEDYSLLFMSMQVSLNHKDEVSKEEVEALYEQCEIEYNNIGIVLGILPEIIKILDKQDDTLVRIKEEIRKDGDNFFKKDSFLFNFFKKDKAVNFKNNDFIKEFLASFMNDDFVKCYKKICLYEERKHLIRRERFFEVRALIADTLNKKLNKKLYAYLFDSLVPSLKNEHDNVEDIDASEICDIYSEYSPTILMDARFAELKGFLDQRATLREMENDEKQEE